MTDLPAATSPPAPGARGYRPDIDGLRTVAVLGVIAFHYGFWPFGGGFVGVDVFFVISGFLITAILASASRRESFSLVDFAERRVRRLLPALLLVLFCCGLAATRMLPNDLRSIGMGLISGATFTSNLFFATLAENYFAAGALTLQPALHTWSLAVEAQFYLVFAVLWTLGRRWARPRAIGIAVLAAASFGFSLWAIVHRPEVAFYGLPARFWEFMLGAALTTAGTFGPRMGGGMVVAGLGAILLAGVVFSATTPFPGAAALLPCLGASLVIAGGSGNPVSRLLGARPLAAMGRLSYALYLWHWPLLVFATYGRATPLTLSTRLGLLALTLLLSLLSRTFVERPLIARRWPRDRRRFLAAAGAAVAGVALLGLAVNLAGQNFLRLRQLPPAVQVLAEGQFDSLDNRCPVGAQAAPACRFGAPDGAPRVALWGNSFARMWLPGLDAAAGRAGASGTSFLLSKCPPLIDTAFPAIPGCAAFNRDALAAILADPRLRTVVLGGNWSEWTDNLPALGRAVAALQAAERRVMVILSPPAVPYVVPRTLALAALNQQPPPPLVSEAEARAARSRPDGMIESLRAVAPFETVDPIAAFCAAGLCRVQADGRTLYYDEAHVSRFAAARASALFDPVFETDSGTP